MRTEDKPGDEALRSWLKADIRIDDHEFENIVMKELIRLSSEKAKRHKTANRISDFVIIGFCLLTLSVFCFSFIDTTVFTSFKDSYASWRLISGNEYSYREYYLILLVTAFLSLIFLTLHWILSKKLLQ